MTHKEHAVENYKLIEAKVNELCDELFDEKFISNQIQLLDAIELRSLKQKALHSSITEDQLIEINNRITILEQKKLMHILKYTE